MEEIWPNSKIRSEGWAILRGLVSIPSNSLAAETMPIIEQYGFAWRRGVSLPPLPSPLAVKPAKQPKLEAVLDRPGRRRLRTGNKPGRSPFAVLASSFPTLREQP
jgi:hypothetical protein